VKKKSPPYALIGAVLLGGVAVFFLYQNHVAEGKRLADAADAVKRDYQAKLDAANKNSQIITPVATDSRNVLYATQPIVAGNLISSSFFEKKLTPKNILPDAYSEQDVIGMYAVRNIEKGDPLTPRNVAKNMPTLEGRIPPGMRAIALPVFNVQNNATGGFAVNGDKVDLLYTQFSEDSKYIYSTRLLLQNLQILYIPGPAPSTDTTDTTPGLVPAPPPGSPVSVTFLVTPEQAQALLYLSEVKNAHIGMILKSRRETDEIKIKPYVGADYHNNPRKIQTMADKSEQRVKDLQAEIEAREKTLSSQPNTNETTTPTPPSP